MSEQTVYLGNPCAIRGVLFELVHIALKTDCGLAVNHLLHTALRNPATSYIDLTQRIANGGDGRFDCEIRLNGSQVKLYAYINEYGELSIKISCYEDGEFQRYQEFIRQANDMLREKGLQSPELD